MTSERQWRARTYGLSTTGAVLVGLFGLITLVSTTTNGPLLGVLSLGLLGGFIVALAAFALDESHVGALVPFAYGIGGATLGLWNYGHDGVLLLTALLIVAGGIVVTASAAHRWKAWTSAPLGAFVGVTGASVILYLL